MNNVLSAALHAKALGLAALCLSALLIIPSAGAQQFEFESIDSDNMGRRAIADIDHDGFNDVIVHRWADDRGKKGNGELSWYRYPNWRKFIIAKDKEFFGDYIEASDLDGDGDVDILAPVGTDGVAKLYAYLQDASDRLDQRVWREVFIGEVKTGKSEAKDIMLADFDLDGREDIAVRSDSAAAIFFNDGNLSYTLREISIPSHEGAVAGDVDGDGDVDLIMNGYWLCNPGKKARTKGWKQIAIDKQWYTQDTGEWRDNSVRVQLADLNGDSRQDIIFTHSEKDQFSFAWYENVKPAKGPKGWIKHDLPKQNYAHTLLAFDADLDGDTDLFTTGTVWNDYNHQRRAKPQLWTNNGKGEFEARVVGDQFNYVGIAGDLDNNGSTDIFGTLAWDRAPIYALRNRLNYHADQWQTHIIDEQRKKFGDFDKNWEWLRYFGLAAIDGETNTKRLVSGRYLYQSSAKEGTKDSALADWQRSDLGINVDAGIAVNVDGDAAQDLIAFQGGKLFWLEEQPGKTEWKAKEIAFEGEFRPADHFNPQGARTADVIPGGRAEVSFEGGDGLYVLDLSNAPASWVLHRVADTTGDGHAWGDIDRDGDLDLVTAATGKTFAISAFINPGKLGKIFSERRIGTLSHDADRVELADMTGDGWLDVVVGQEVYPVGSSQTDVYLFTHPGSAKLSSAFKRSVLLPEAESVNSLRLADLDFDGDIDVLLGEMGGKKRVLVLENSGDGKVAKVHTVALGKEIHGLILSDLDGDKDIDAAAIAWDNHPFMYVFENLAVDTYAKGEKKKP